MSYRLFSHSQQVHETNKQKSSWSEKNSISFCICSCSEDLVMKSLNLQEVVLHLFSINLSSEQDGSTGTII